MASHIFGLILPFTLLTLCWYGQALHISNSTLHNTTSIETVNQNNTQTVNQNTTNIKENNTSLAPSISSNSSASKIIEKDEVGVANDGIPKENNPENFSDPETHINNTKCGNKSNFLTRESCLEIPGGVNFQDLENDHKVGESIRSSTGAKHLPSHVNHGNYVHIQGQYQAPLQHTPPKSQFNPSILQYNPSDVEQRPPATSYSPTKSQHPVNEPVVSDKTHFTPHYQPSFVQDQLKAIQNQLTALHSYHSIPHSQPSSLQSPPSLSQFQSSFPSTQSQTSSIQNQPTSIHNQPSSTQNQHSTQNQPFSTQSRPLSTVSQSFSTQNQPQTLQNQPQFSQNKPLSSQNQPHSSQNQPLSSQNQSLSSHNQPQSSQNQPLSSQNQPLSSQSQPQSLQNQPQSSQGQPQSSQNQPQSSQTQPQSLQNQPLSSQGQPQSSQNQPQSSQNQPQSSQNQPLSSQNQPLSSQSSPTQPQTTKNQGSFAPHGHHPTSPHSHFLQPNTGIPMIDPSLANVRLPQLGNPKDPQRTNSKVLPVGTLTHLASYLAHNKLQRQLQQQQQHLHEQIREHQILEQMEKIYLQNQELEKQRHILSQYKNPEGDKMGQLNTRQRPTSKPKQQEQSQDHKNIPPHRYTGEGLINPRTTLSGEELEDYNPSQTQPENKMKHNRNRNGKIGHEVSQRDTPMDMADIFTNLQILTVLTNQGQQNNQNFENHALKNNKNGGNVVTFPPGSVAVGSQQNIPQNKLPPQMGGIQQNKVPPQMGVGDFQSGSSSHTPSLISQRFTQTPQLPSYMTAQTPQHSSALPSTLSPLMSIKQIQGRTKMSDLQSYFPNLANFPYIDDDVGSFAQESPSSPQTSHGSLKPTSLNFDSFHPHWTAHDFLRPTVPTQERPHHDSPRPVLPIQESPPSIPTPDIIYPTPPSSDSLRPTIPTHNISNLSFLQDSYSNHATQDSSKISSAGHKDPGVVETDAALSFNVYFPRDPPLGTAPPTHSSTSSLTVHNVVDASGPMLLHIPGTTGPTHLKDQQNTFSGTGNIGGNEDDGAERHIYHNQPSVLQQVLPTKSPKPQHSLQQTQTQHTSPQHHTPTQTHHPSLQHHSLTQAQHSPTLPEYSPFLPSSPGVDLNKVMNQFAHSSHTAAPPGTHQPSSSDDPLSLSNFSQLAALSQYLEELKQSSQGGGGPSHSQEAVLAALLMTTPHGPVPPSTLNQDLAYVPALHNDQFLHSFPPAAPPSPPPVLPPAPPPGTVSTLSDIASDTPVAASAEDCLKSRPCAIFASWLFATVSTFAFAIPVLVPFIGKRRRRSLSSASPNDEGTTDYFHELLGWAGRNDPQMAETAASMLRFLRSHRNHLLAAALQQSPQPIPPHVLQDLIEGNPLILLDHLRHLQYNQDSNKSTRKAVPTTFSDATPSLSPPPAAIPSVAHHRSPISPVSHRHPSPSGLDSQRVPGNSPPPSVSHRHPSLSGLDSQRAPGMKGNGEVMRNMGGFYKQLCRAVVGPDIPKNEVITFIAQRCLILAYAGVLH